MRGLRSVSPPSGPCAIAADPRPFPRATLRRHAADRRLRRGHLQPWTSEWPGRPRSRGRPPGGWSPRRMPRRAGWAFPGGRPVAEVESAPCRVREGGVLVCPSRRPPLAWRSSRVVTVGPRAPDRAPDAAAGPRPGRIRDRGRRKARPSGRRDFFAASPRPCPRAPRTTDRRPRRTADDPARRGWGIHARSGLGGDDLVCVPDGHRGLAERHVEPLFGPSEPDVPVGPLGRGPVPTGGASGAGPGPMPSPLRARLGGDIAAPDGEARTPRRAGHAPAPRGTHEPPAGSEGPKLPGPPPHARRSVVGDAPTRHSQPAERRAGMPQRRAPPRAPCATRRRATRRRASRAAVLPRPR